MWSRAIDATFTEYQKLDFAWNRFDGSQSTVASVQLFAGFEALFGGLPRSAP